MVAVARRRLIVAASCLGVLTGCDKLFPGSGRGPEAFEAIDVTGADYAKTLSMPDTDGRTRSLAEFRGKVVVVFFGYVQCPDVCPTTMAELAAVKRELGADGARVQGVFVTVDPERDTSQVLKAYMANFDPSFVALRGSPDEVKAAAKHFKIFFGKVPGKTDTSYTVDHTAGSYVFDTQGRVRLFTRYGSGASALAADIRQLLKQAA